MNHENRTDFTEVFNGDYWQGALIQQLLAEHEIQSFLRNALMGSLEPFAVVAGGANPVSIVVPTDNYESARSLIKEYNEATPEDEQP
ncbi:putative signal transducing protein [Pedobacter nyackensis]|uniref:Putative signal transducing protein n=1 Tax=Pedobacter nyackensis TaxID=475255 RepID=A0A1W2ANN6_9SPHI|nr:DUF2007 domain-containing protein [Pedobacter nyackensis]SMC62051.1 Putative signal transducing protein [Pedobacter nyackensis]